MWVQMIEGHNCGFLIVDACFANILDLSLHFLDFFVPSGSLHCESLRGGSD